MTDTTSVQDEATETPTVLVVEDDIDLADLYVAWLADTYDVRTAYGGEEALEELDGTVDVVLLDRRMPGLSGDDVLAEIREQELDCRVVIISAVDPDFDVIGMGFDDYLTKPVNTDELHETVDRMLSRAAYDETLQDLYQLVSTQAALEAQKGEAELRASDEYADLQEQIKELQAAADGAFKEFTEKDFEDSLREIDSDIHE